MIRTALTLLLAVSLKRPDLPALCPGYLAQLPGFFFLGRK